MFGQAPPTSALFESCLADLKDKLRKAGFAIANVAGVDKSVRIAAWLLTDTANADRLAGVMHQPAGAVPFKPDVVVSFRLGACNTTKLAIPKKSREQLAALNAQQLKILSTPEATEAYSAQVLPPAPPKAPAKPRVGMWIGLGLGLAAVATGVAVTFLGAGGMADSDSY